MVCSRILCRIRNAGSGDQDNRHREQLRQDPLPEIGSHAAGSGARTTGTDPEPGTSDQQRDLSADGVRQDPLPDPERW